MKVILRRMDVMGELSIEADELVEADRLLIGRGTDQHLELPDMRLSLAHSDIRELREGEYLIESRTQTGVWVNGVPAPRHRLNTGDTIDCGRFRMVVGAPPPGADLLLEIVERQSASDEKAGRRERYRINLKEGGLRMRRPAWILAGALLLATLMAPVALRYFTPSSTSGMLSLDRLWESGPRSPAHARFLSDCGTCHQQPFEPVKNDACLACHKDVAGHSDRLDVNSIVGMGDARCGACHLEHTGTPALRASAPGTCVDCHANPEPRFAAAHMQPVKEFGKDHPAFSPLVPRYTDGKGFHFEKQIQQPGISLLEDNNLIFPHDAHLDPQGLRTPDGTRVLACADCHQAQAQGAGFRPIRMTEQCASCHRLDFDTADPDRLLPHGQPAEVARIIRDHFARQALAGDRQDPAAPEIVRMRRVPGEALIPEQRRAALDWADAQADRTISEVFERRACGACHVVEPTGDSALPFRIAPVRLSNTYLTGARFDHAAHRTQECSHCHKASESSDSRTLLLPDIQNCRACHGDPTQSSMVPTQCSDCHSFHGAKNTVMGGVAGNPP